MNNSVPQTAEELKQFVMYLDHTLIEQFREKLKGCYREILEVIDKVIAEHRNSDLQIEHCREVWYQTCLGAVKIKRRQYRDKDGQRRCLLDELMGMDKYQHKTVKVQELALDLVSQMPYRRSSETLLKTTAIDLPHQTIWRMLQKAADKRLAKEEQELKWFKLTGELPESEDKRVSCLLTEMDSVVLPLQRERAKRAEVKLSITHEGWEKVGKDRYRTINKTVYGTVGSQDDFLTGLSLKLHQRYDLAGIPYKVVGGDGAGWIKAGAEYMGSRFQLDRYHLQKELTLAYGRDHQTKSRIWQACERGEAALALEIAAESRQKVTGERLRRIDGVYRYLKANVCGLGDYRLEMGEEGQRLRHTGAMEGNVDKLVVRRMKNQGMSWSLQGIKRLLCIRFLAYAKKLTDWLENKHSDQNLYDINIPQRKARRLVNKLSLQESDQWLKAALPALRGPHASRPWVLALKSLMEDNIF